MTLHSETAQGPRARWRGLIFDIDGTILDSADVIRFSFVDVVQELLGRTIDPDEHNWILGCPGAESLRRLGYAGDIDQALRIWYGHYSNHEHRMKYFEGFPDVLDQLARCSAPMGVITNNLRFKYDHLASVCGFDRWFTQVRCCNEGGQPKPAPDPLLSISAAWGIAPQDLVYIGDSANDMHCALSAGADFIAAGWGAHDLQVFEQYRQPIASHPHELVEMILG